MSHFKGIIQFPSRQALPTSLEQIFFRQYNSLVFRNGTTQMLFLTPTRNMSAGKFAMLVRFLVVLREDIFYNVD